MTTDCWYRLDLGNGADALPKTFQVYNDFTAFFLAAAAAGKHPTGAILLLRYDMDRDNVELFFNPNAQSIALLHGALHCHKPAVNEWLLTISCAEDVLAATDYLAQHGIV